VEQGVFWFVVASAMYDNRPLPADPLWGIITYIHILSIHLQRFTNLPHIFFSQQFDLQLRKKENGFRVFDTTNITENAVTSAPNLVEKRVIDLLELKSQGLCSVKLGFGSQKKAHPAKKRCILRTENFKVFCRRENFVLVNFSGRVSIAVVWS
jgi:hypothetical protein